MLMKLLCSMKDFFYSDLLNEFQTLRRSITSQSAVPCSSHGNAASQLLLALKYQQIKMASHPLPSFRDVGFRVYSQTDEDGILLYIFSLIGTTNKLCVEISAGDGSECNSANLIINHGWHGLLVDGDEEHVTRGRDYFARCRDTYVYPPKFISAWVTAENVNAVIEDAGFQGGIDLLSVDIDGIDYWIWKAIEVIQPRVVVVEYQDIIGPERSITIPYVADFRYSDYPCTQGMPNYCGASLRAFVNLAKIKGYRLVGTNRYGYNAFFVLNSEGKDVLPEISVESCFTHPKVVWGMKERFPTVAHLPWAEV